MNIIFLFVVLGLVSCQYRKGSDKYEEVMETNQQILTEQLKSHSDVEMKFYPERALINSKSYRIDFPKQTDYVINVIINPCEGLEFDCCMGIYGSPEYGSLKGSLETYLNNDEPLKNVLLISAAGGDIAPGDSRLVDDEAYIAEECNEAYDPYNSTKRTPTHCGGFRKGLKRPGNDFKVGCIDNNSSVVSTQSCQHPIQNVVTGVIQAVNHTQCVQVAYSHSAFIVQCAGKYSHSLDCGTFIEIHRPSGSHYHEETFVIAEQEILTRNVSGYYTTSISLNYGIGVTNRILCDFSESKFRVGLMVKISDTAPECCCAAVAKVTADGAGLLGMYQCPTNGFLGGITAPYLKTREELMADEEIMIDGRKRCPYQADAGRGLDVMMCGRYDAKSGRYYSSPCHSAAINSTSGLYTSLDLDGEYDGICPYFPSCGLIAGAGTSGRKRTCSGSDYKLTFTDMVGKLIQAPVSEEDLTWLVTFNDGRSWYSILEADMVLKPPVHNYELWWVQRTRSERIVQVRKPFKISLPKCTFDTTNDRYFPYAVLDENGELVD